MTTGSKERRQRWAAFSVRAHRDLGSLAADILLYDRIILPVPEDDQEYDRWVRKRWEPDEIGKRIVQSAGHILGVPWTAQLRAQWQDRWSQLRHLGGELAYGLTGVIYATSQDAWQEIAASLQPDEVPKQKPAILAGYQSAEEAKAELQLRPAQGLQESEPQSPPESTHLPGGRPVDLVVAAHIRRMVYEPAIADPRRAFLTAIELAEDDRFQQIRRRLFDWEDGFFVDQRDPTEAEKELPELEQEYRAVVKAKSHEIRKRQVATILPMAAGWGAVAVGHPHFKNVASKVVQLVAGFFTSIPSSPYANVDPDTHPGAALEMIRAAYRSEQTDAA